MPEKKNELISDDLISILTRPLTLHLKSHPSKTNKTFGTLLEMMNGLRSDDLQWILTLPLRSHLKSNPSKTNQTFGTMPEKNKELINYDLLWFLRSVYASFKWPTRTFLHQLCKDTGSILEDLMRDMEDRDGWTVRDSGRSVVTRWLYDDYDIISLIGSKEKKICVAGFLKREYSWSKRCRVYRVKL